MAACNPYRKPKKEIKHNGLIYNEPDKNTFLYNVNLLPHSLMNFIYYFGTNLEKDEQKYIDVILKEEIFNNFDNNSKVQINRMLAISHKYVKKYGNDSSVSLRELKRFKDSYSFFQSYLQNKKDLYEKEKKTVLIEKEGLKDKPS